ncbi:hypothetical protein LTR62_000017 [Meristemomyces frigidus]|uniref:Formin GTPase-binding domain-containing protein n=1 Tax=Meristemomyces frigidus TaxID=1508187 RepID=A0AAN7TIG9_9PEZI|nr:hypothetical protein LTR62_000017 [Meristemomyces frigidus]
MEASNSSTAQRPGHKRNASSKSGLLRSLVSSKTRPVLTAEPVRESVVRTTSVPLLPPDHPQVGKTSRVLGERQGNVQSPPSSPTKSRRPAIPISTKFSNIKVPTKSQDGASTAKKSKSSTNLSAMFAKMNRSNKDLSTTVHKDKENTTPPTSASGPAQTPIWAQFSSTTAGKSSSRPGTKDGEPLSSISDEIAKYTPKNYSPSKQRNFDGTLEQPSMRPTLNNRPRPQSAYFSAAEGLAAIGRRVSGQRDSIEGRRSEDMGRRLSRESSRRVSGDRSGLVRRSTADRKVSGSSTEQANANKQLNVAKRGNRVMAAVAAFQSRGRTEQPVRQEAVDERAVDVAFEAVLDSRQIPEPMRQKMRSLTMRVKADFIKQNQGQSSSPTEAAPSSNADALAALTSSKRPGDSPETETAKDTKRSRSRPRSRTFTFSKGDRKGDTSPTKKDRAQSKSRPTSIQIPKDGVATPSTNPPSSPFGSLGRRSAAQAIPADYIKYLQTHPDPTKTEVGRLHKLRILLRNETVAWVDSFLSLGGMTEIVGLLHRTMATEWREEHEDQLLHETLLCLKGLCTTERAMEELEGVADELFPALVGMLFDGEKRGPAEYGTRTVIVNVLLTFLASATNTSPSALEARARRILTYLGEPPKPSDERPVDFVLDMHRPRPYRLWSKEVTNVTKEVFWIFLHQLNVVPLPKRPGSSSATTAVGNANNEDRAAAVQQATYPTRHFPGSRPPVPAAPYIGGVEWDATTYITSHLDLLNGLLASLPTTEERNVLRAELRASGFERVMGGTLRTCKEKFYSGVHDALRGWVAAACEDGWETRFVREGPSGEEERGQVGRGFCGSPRKGAKKEAAPQLGEVAIEALPKLDLGLDGLLGGGGGGFGDDGWVE